MNSETVPTFCEITDKDFVLSNYGLVNFRISKNVL